MKKPLLIFLLIICSLYLHAQTVEGLLKSAIDKQNSGDNEGCIADCNKALSIEAGNAIIFNVRGLSKYNLGLYEDAIDDYTRTIRSYPANAIAYNYRGSSKYYLKQYKEAIKDFTEAIHLYSKYVSAYNNRGNAKVKQYMFNEAIADYSEAININPENAAAYNNRAFAKNKTGKFAEAIADCNKAISIDPKTAVGAFRNRGNAKIALAMYEDGIADCNKSISLNLENPKAYNYRGYAYFKLGKYDLAIKDDNSSTEFQKDNDDSEAFWDYREEAEQKLKEITNARKSATASNVNKPAGVIAALPTAIAENKVPAAIAPVETNSANNFVTFDWVKPVEDFSSLPDGILKLTDNNEVAIKIKVLSNNALDPNKFHLYLNGQDFSNGNKMTVAEIEELKNKASVHVYNYKAIVKVGMDKSVIKLTYGNLSSEELTVIYAPMDINLHVLAIGTQAQGLKYPEKDATDFAALFAGQKGDHKLFHDVSAETLLGADAKAQTMSDKIIEWSNKRYNERDVLILFISSHGFTDDGKLLITGSDYRSTAKKFTTIDFKESVLDPLQGVNCKKFVFIDACNSGAGIAGSKATPLDVSSEISKLVNSGNSTTIISSSSSSEKSWEDDSWNNGAFTKAIKEALTEMKADKDGNGLITMNELFTYVTDRVAELIKLAGKKDEYGNPVTQTPKMFNPRGNVSIFLK